MESTERKSIISSKIGLQRCIISILSAVAVSLFVFYFILPVWRGYDYFTAYAAGLIGRTERLEYLRTIFRSSSYSSLKIILSGILAVLIIGAVYATWRPTPILQSARMVVKFLGGPLYGFMSFWKKTPAAIKKYLYIIVGSFFCLGLYFIFKVPVTGDEAYTYLSFVKPGPLVAATYYPYPNNHVLFSIYSYPFSLLPLPFEVKLRLPALLVMVACILALFRLLSAFFDRKAAVVAAGIFAFLYPVVLYGYLSRGYCLYLLFYILALHYVIQAVLNNNTKAWWYFVFFSIAGFYTLPSFLYGFASLCIWATVIGLASGNKYFLRICLYGLIIAAVTGLLYAPLVFFSGGFSSFYHIVNIDFEDKVPFTWFFLQLITQIHYTFPFYENAFLSFVCYLIIITGIVYQLYSRNVLVQKNAWIWAMLLNYLIPVLMLVVQQKIPFSRTSIFLSVQIVFAIAFFIDPYINRRRFISYLIPLPFFIMAFILAGKKGNYYSKIFEQAEVKAKPIANILIAEKVQTCYNFDLPLYYSLIAAYMADVNRKVIFYHNTAGTVSSEPFNNTRQYDAILISPLYDTLVPRLQNDYNLKYSQDGLKLFINKRTR